MLRTAIGSGSHRFVGILLVTLTLTACGGDGGSSTAQSTLPPVSNPITAPPAPTPTPAKNNPPVISGAAASAITAGQAYNFQPSAQDADEDVITFTIANKPSWASFDAGTGKLSGTPTEKQTGTYKDIEIAATDGKDVTALKPFTIAVNAPAANSDGPTVALDWHPPTENTDGTALTNLKGYKLHYGTKTKTYTESIVIDNPGVLSYVVDDLPKGTYYFALTAFNSSGAESDFSNEITHKVN
jgi:putative Ig domain-containing protein